MVYISMVATILLRDLREHEFDLCEDGCRFLVLSF